MISEQLWQENLQLARQCLEHPFVQGLGNGTLDPAVFRVYVGQDAFFLQAFLRAYAIAAGHCENWEQTKQFHHLMTGVLEELELHARFATTLGIDLSSVTPLQATKTYTDFLLRTAWGANIAETLAAMTPCLRLYAFLGTELAKRPMLGNRYQDWIDTYSSSSFQDLCRELEGMLNESGYEFERLGEVYRYAMVCELDFFSAPIQAIESSQEN